MDDYEQLDVQNVLDPEFCSHVSNAEEETGGGGDTDGPDVREVLRELLMDRLLLEHLPVVMQDHLGKEVEQHDTSMPHMRPHPHQRSLRQEGQDEEEQGTCAVEEQHVEPAWLHVLQQTRLWESLSHAHDTETYIDVENHGHVEDQMLDLYALQNSASQLAVGQGDLGVMCHGSSFGRDATVTRASNGEMELLDVTQDDVLPGQVSSPTRRSVPARPSAYSRAGASLHADLVVHFAAHEPNLFLGFAPRTFHVGKLHAPPRRRCSAIAFAEPGAGYQLLRPPSTSSTLCMQSCTSPGVG